MERDDRFEIDLPDADLPGDGGGFVPPEPPERGGGGGGGGGARRRAPEPFFESRWGPAVSALIISLFGLQTLLVIAVSRSGMGNEAVAWLLGGSGVVMFVGLLWVGAKYVERHRRAPDPAPEGPQGVAGGPGAGSAGGPAPGDAGDGATGPVPGTNT